MGRFKLQTKVVYNLAGQVAHAASRGFGLRGHVTTAVGVRLPFEVTEVVPGQRWSWRVAGVPATDHRVEVVGGRTVATIGIPTWAPFYTPVCRIGLRRIAERAEQ